MWGDPFLLKMEQFPDRPVQWSIAGQLKDLSTLIDLSSLETFFLLYVLEFEKYVLDHFASRI
jgi:hypothetical protein